MKKIMAVMVLICAILLVGSPLVSAYAQDIENIEIKFKVGDSELLINGDMTTVTTPYVVNGTTLVPLRVITEAFGAEVGWDGETQAVTLSYDGATIRLTIDSKTATVGDQDMELLEAPELKEGSTMVPLRFITEHFGATVNFEGQTGEITVAKSMEKNETSGELSEEGNLNVAFTKERFGDSYFGWSMKVPPNMQLSERSFDGTYTYLESYDDGEEMFFELIIEFVNEEERSLDYHLSEIKDYTRGSTLIRAAIDTDGAGVKFAHAQHKTKNYFEDIRVYVKENRAYMLFTYLDADISVEKRDEKLEFSNSFKLSFSDGASTQDLSNINSNGFRKYENKEFNLSFDIPKDWLETTDEDQANYLSFHFLDEEYFSLASFSMGVYSVETGLSLTDWAKRDYERNVSVYNPKFIKASDIAGKKIGDLDCVSYTVEVKFGKDTFYIEDIYTFVGSYGYNFSYTYSSDYKNQKDAISAIVGSVKIEPLERNVIGELQMNDEFDLNPSKKFTLSDKKFSITLPKIFVEAESGTYVAMDYRILVLVTRASSQGVPKDGMEYFADYYAEASGFEVKSKATPTRVNGIAAYVMEFYDPESQHYLKQWIVDSKNGTYIITVAMPEIFNGGSLDKAIANAVDTVKVD